MARSIRGRHRNVRGKWSAWWGAVVLGLTSAVVVPMVGQTAQADVPPVPVAAAFDAARCTGSTLADPADNGGAVANLLSVFGGRLDDYNAGAVVPLYDSFGDNDAEAPGGGYPAVCAVRYDSGVGGPVSDWMFCTDYTSRVCAGVNEDGDLVDLNGVVLPPTNPVSGNPKLTADTERIIVALINGAWPYAGTGSFNFGVTEARADGTSWNRVALQELLWCLTDPPPVSATQSELERTATCANSMSSQTQAEILASVPAAPSLDVAADAPSTDLEIGSTATFTVTTNIQNTPIALTLTGPASGLTLLSGPATLDGTTLTVAGEGPVQLTVTGTGSGAVVLAAAIETVSSEQLAWHQSQRTDGQLCQIYSTMFGVPQTYNGSATAAFVEDAVPAIGTTLTDQLDGDHHIVQAGGIVEDTVAYEGLEPNTEYSLTGELFDGVTGTPTGIVGTTVFTSSDTGSGTAVVVFDEFGDAWAGFTLVAFEYLFLDDQEVASHTDLDDVAQTVYVADLATTLVDSADGDQNVAAAGGVVVDTVTYTHLLPNTEYTVAGELIDKGPAPGLGSSGLPRSPRPRPATTPSRWSSPSATRGPGTPWSPSSC